MDKVFITKSDLEKTVLKKKNNMTPFLFIFVWVYAIICTVILLPIIFVWVLFTVLVIFAYLPFYFIDRIFERKKDG
jgi:fatty acid desaturase